MLADDLPILYSLLPQPFLNVFCGMRSPSGLRPNRGRFDFGKGLLDKNLEVRHGVNGFPIDPHFKVQVRPSGKSG